MYSYNQVFKNLHWSTSSLILGRIKLLLLKAKQYKITSYGPLRDFPWLLMRTSTSSCLSDMPFIYYEKLCMSFAHIFPIINFVVLSACQRFVDYIHSNIFFFSKNSLCLSLVFSLSLWWLLMDILVFKFLFLMMCLRVGMCMSAQGVSNLMELKLQLLWTSRCGHWKPSSCPLHGRAFSCSVISPTSHSFSFDTDEMNFKTISYFFLLCLV